MVQHTVLKLKSFYKFLIVHPDIVKVLQLNLEELPRGEVDSSTLSAVHKKHMSVLLLFYLYPWYTRVADLAQIPSTAIVVYYAVAVIDVAHLQCLRASR